MRVPGRWSRGSATCLFVCLVWSLLANASPRSRSQGIVLPGGFTQEVVVSGLEFPTAFAALPDGRLLIAEKSGVVRLFKDGALQPTPFIDLRSRVNAHHDRGLLGLVVDPAFATNGFVYLLYTYDDDDTDDAGPKTGRLARYTAAGDTASPASEHVLVGTVVGNSCHDFPHGADCIPSDSPSHSVGSVRFAGDGPYLGDVGWTTYEEINVASAGANLGWPCYEGPFRQPGYELKQECQLLYGRGPSAVKPPLHVWDHSAGRTATGGAFYTGVAYPEEWRGAYFFADYGEGWLGALRVDADDNLVPGSVTTFATDVGGPVALDVGPDSNLFSVDILAGELRRLRYTVGNTPPTAVASAIPSNGGVPLHVRFSSAGSSDPDGDALQYTWDFDDGSPPSSLPHPEHTYGTPGVYSARLTVSDGRGGSHTATVRVSVGNRAPVVTIATPSPSYRFRVGDGVTYSGSASDAEDGPIPDAGLAWTLTLHHCTDVDCHAHPYSTSTGPTGSFTVADHGDEVYFELTLTATDSAGLTGSASITLHPWMVQMRLETSPPGLEVVFDGMALPAPFVRPVIVGSTHTAHVASPQGDAVFLGWADGGGTGPRDIVAGTTDATYTALFGSDFQASCPQGQFRAEYFNNPVMAGTPALVRCESAPLSHNWHHGSPSPLWVVADGFSVRWTGTFYLPSGGYFFAAEADDGVRLYVDGSRIINAWKDQGPTTYVMWRYLRSGMHRVVMEYYENSGGAVAGLRWWR